MHNLCIHAIQNSLPKMQTGELDSVEQVYKLDHILPLEGDIFDGIHLNPISVPVTHTLDAVGQVVHTILLQPGGQNLIPNGLRGCLRSILPFPSEFCQTILPPFQNLCFTHGPKDGILSVAGNLCILAKNHTFSGSPSHFSGLLTSNSKLFLICGYPTPFDRKRQWHIFTDVLHGVHF